jgi:hypothetical protein
VSLDRLGPAAASTVIRQLWDRPDGAVILTSFDVLLQLHPHADMVIADLILGGDDGDDHGHGR